MVSPTPTSQLLHTSLYTQIHILTVSLIFRFKQAS